MSALKPSLRRTALTFKSMLQDLKEEYVERDTAVDVMALAVLCREHVLLIGPPGTAKTALVEQFSTMLHARYFNYLLTKFTEPAELFGAIDVRSFQNDSVYRINTEGMLPKVEIAFLDEIFNGSSAILNTLLTLINERTFYNGCAREPADLITLLGATNDIPDDPVLLAFCDRFLFRCRLDYVSNDVIHDVLDIGWATERARLVGSAGRPAVADASGLDRHALDTLQRAVGEVDLSGIRHDLAGILQSMRDEAVTFSDRRGVKAQKAIAARALLNGRGRAELEDLAVLVHLWTTPYDEETIRRVVEIHGVPVELEQAGVRDIGEIEFQLVELRRQSTVVSAQEEYREILRQLGRLVAEVRAAHPTASVLLQQLQQAQRSVIQAAQNSAEYGGLIV